MSALAYVVIALASYRLARIVTTDTISTSVRARLYSWAWDDEAGAVERRSVLDGGDVLVPVARGPIRTYVYDLFTCPVCFGVWASAGVYSAWRWWDTTAVHAVIAILGVAGLQCFLATREGA